MKIRETTRYVVLISLVSEYFNFAVICNPRSIIILFIAALAAKRKSSSGSMDKLQLLFHSFLSFKLRLRQNRKRLEICTLLLSVRNFHRSNINGNIRSDRILVSESKSSRIASDQEIFDGQ